MHSCRNIGAVHKLQVDEIFPRGVPFEIKGRKSHRVTERTVHRSPESHIEIMPQVPDEKEGSVEKYLVEACFADAGMRCICACILRLPAWTIFGGNGLIWISPTRLLNISVGARPCMAELFMREV